MSNSEKKRPWTLSRLAQEIGEDFDGDGSIQISGVAGIHEAGPEQITFLGNPKYAASLDQTEASAVILSPGIPTGIPAIRCKNPYLAFAKVATLFLTRTHGPVGVSPDLVKGEACRLGHDLSIHARVVLGRNVHLGDRVTLHPGVVIGDDSVVGDDSILYSSVSVREGVRIGRRAVIHCGVVIGSDGFGFAPDGEKYFKIPQTGGVRIGDDVEIGANTTIDRGTLGDTVIGQGTKIDNLVQIAHNVIVGENCVIVSQTGISGSTTIGNHVTLAGRVAVTGHLKIGDGVTVGGKSGVTKDVDPGKIVAGFPAIDHRDWLKAASSFTHLPSMRKELKRLQEHMDRLEQRISRGEENDGN